MLRNFGLRGVFAIPLVLIAALVFASSVLAASSNTLTIQFPSTPQCQVFASGTDSFSYCLWGTGQESWKTLPSGDVMFTANGDLTNTVTVNGVLVATTITSFREKSRTDAGALMMEQEHATSTAVVTNSGQTCTFNTVVRIANSVVKYDQATMTCV